MQTTMDDYAAEEFALTLPAARPTEVLSTLGQSIPVYSVQLVRERRERYAAGVNMTIRSAADADRIARQLLEDQSREHLVALLLDTKNKVAGINVVSIGILDSALVHPREVFQAAVLANAASIILCHNHPSGDPTPSSEDLRITTRISECGKLMGIELLDHIIIGHQGRYTSLKERGTI